MDGVRISGGVEFIKGHGTQNDFVLLPDVDGALDLTEERVRALCDRRRGIGADGVLRVVRTDRIADVPSTVDDSAHWFMDYRNADGSIAEMCGNGVRVFVRYLVDAGLAEIGEFAIGTRSGTRRVVANQDGTVTVAMGPALVTGTSAATVGDRTFPGVAVDVGNPHLVCPLDDSTDLAALDLSVPPEHDSSVFPHGVNVEFVESLGVDAVRIRVHERGVGETRSCGTGTVAVVAAVLHEAGRSAGTYTVHVPGGQVVVTVDNTAAEPTSTLTGPAVLLASGVLDPAWWG